MAGSNTTVLGSVLDVVGTFGRGQSAQVRQDGVRCRLGRQIIHSLALVPSGTSLGLDPRLFSMRACCKIFTLWGGRINRIPGNVIVRFIYSGKGGGPSRQTHAILSLQYDEWLYCMVKYATYNILAVRVICIILPIAQAAPRVPHHHL